MRMRCLRFLAAIHIPLVGCYKSYLLRRRPDGISSAPLEWLRPLAGITHKPNASLNMLLVPNPQVLPSELQVDLSAAPPFTLSDLKNAIPSHLFKRKAGYSLGYLARDVAVVLGLAAAAQAVNTWCGHANLALHLCA